MTITGKGGRTTAPAYIYRENQLAVPAFALLQLSDRDLSGYRKMGVIRVKVGDFRLRRPIRSVRRFPWIDAHQGESPTATGVAMNPEPQLSGRRTRWDIDADALFDQASADAQRVLIRVVLHDNLEFFDPALVPAITAKDAASQQGLANLTVDKNPANLWRANFWALRPANTSAVVKHGFNIAVVATDDTDPAFSLPVIIDPTIRNRG